MGAANPTRYPLGAAHGEWLAESSGRAHLRCTRANGPFTSTQDLALRCALDAGDLKALASADALISPRAAIAASRCGMPLPCSPAPALAARRAD